LNNANNGFLGAAECRPHASSYLRHRLRKTLVLAALLALTFHGSSQAKGIRRHDRLRQPGFVFVELFTQDLPGYIDFFQTVAGFKLIRNEGTFVQLQSEHSEILLNSTKDHPFLKEILDHRRALALELGIVVTDLDKAHAAARKFQGWKIVAGIVRQPWGPRDFRVLSPDGYYLRLTEPSS
jgi:lactoylglutathione lyase